MRKPKATAAELRNKARMSMPCVCEDYCRCDVTTVVDDDALDEILAVARAEAVAPVMDVLRAVLAVAPRCDSKRQANTGRCGEVAVHSSMGVHRCDAHGEGWKDGPRSRALRAALALLAADQADAKAGRP